MNSKMNKVDKAIDLAIDGVDRTIKNLRKNFRGEEPSSSTILASQTIKTGFSSSSEFSDSVGDSRAMTGKGMGRRPVSSFLSNINHSESQHTAGPSSVFFIISF